MAASKRLYEALAESFGLELGYQWAKQSTEGESVLVALVSKVCAALKSDNHGFDDVRFKQAVLKRAQSSKASHLKVEAN